MPVRFFFEDVRYDPGPKRILSSWIKSEVIHEGSRPGELNFILCSDDYLLQMNRRYLQHDYYTDIITFPAGEPGNLISGDMFISIDRVLENATLNGNAGRNELWRVMIHGVLHLLGYEDKSPENEKAMRKREDLALSRLRHLQEN